MNAILRTAFLTSLVSYSAFILFDVLRPGFVSHVFSVHWFLVPAIVFGVWWGVRVEDREPPATVRRVLSIAVELVIGIVIAVFVWRFGGAFGDFRLVATLAALFLPILVMQTLRV